MRRLPAGLELDLDERADFGRILNAVIEGRYIDDWEFETLIGVDKQAARTLARQFHGEPLVAGELESLLMNGAVNLLGYPHGLALPLPKERLRTLIERLETA